MKQIAYACFTVAGVVASMTALEIRPSWAYAAFWLVAGIITGVIALAIEAASSRP